MVEEVDPTELADLLRRVPQGWSKQTVAGIAWGLSRVEHVGGRTTTLSAHELAGSGFLSANVWHTTSGDLLRPCEVPAADVMALLRGLPPAD